MLIHTVDTYLALLITTCHAEVLNRHISYDTPVFIAGLFTIARTWKQPKCPSTGEWIRKMQYIHTLEYCSVIERNESGSVVVRRINLEPVIQKEVSQKEKNKYHIISIYMGSRKWYL